MKVFGKRRLEVDPREGISRKTQIEVLLECTYCTTKFWAKRRDAKTCSDNCRSLKCSDKKNLKKSKK